MVKKTEASEQEVLDMTRGRAEEVAPYSALELALSLPLYLSSMALECSEVASLLEKKTMATLRKRYARVVSRRLATLAEVVLLIDKGTWCPDTSYHLPIARACTLSGEVLKELSLVCAAIAESGLAAVGNPTLSAGRLRLIANHLTRFREQLPRPAFL